MRPHPEITNTLIRFYNFYTVFIPHLIQFFSQMLFIPKCIQFDLFLVKELISVECSPYVNIFSPLAPLPVTIFLPGLPSHFSPFGMHTSNNINYKYVSLWYINFSQDVTQFSKEAFWLYMTLFFFPSLCVCTHNPTWLHVLSRTPPSLLLLWRLSQVSQVELVAVSLAELLSQ